MPGAEREKKNEQVFDITAMLQQHRKCYSVTHSSMVHDICAEEARVETTIGETKLTFYQIQLQLDFPPL